MISGSEWKPTLSSNLWCHAWYSSLSVTPVLRYSILAGIMGPQCKAISDWFIDLWAGSVLIHINVMTLPALLRPTYRYWLFSSKNCGKMSGKYHKGILLNICFPHHGSHSTNQGNWRGEKKDLRRLMMTSMKLNSNIPNNQDAGQSIMSHSPCGVSPSS